MSESDLEIKSALPKRKVQKPPKSPTIETLASDAEGKKLSTKEMINTALTDLKSRKGTSLYAIKKYLKEKFLLDVEKKNYIIKKTLKDSVETGSIVQLKGIGASGSFKLANKEKPVKKPEKEKKVEEKAAKPKPKMAKEKKVVTVEMVKTKSTGMKGQVKNTEEKIKKDKPVKIAKGLETPSKKKSAMMKRKSIGSIIKKPKMKPASKA